jgi:hypothetical protein
MKTFRELIAWELEQDRKQRRSASPEENGGSKLTDSMLRKLRYLSSNVSSAKEFPQNFGTA